MQNYACVCSYTTNVSTTCNYASGACGRRFETLHGKSAIKSHRHIHIFCARNVSVPRLRAHSVRIVRLDVARRRRSLCQLTRHGLHIRTQKIRTAAFTMASPTKARTEPNIKTTAPTLRHDQVESFAHASLITAAAAVVALLFVCICVH